MKRKNNRMLKAITIFAIMFSIFASLSVLDYALDASIDVINNTSKPVDIFVNIPETTSETKSESNKTEYSEEVLSTTPITLEYYVPTESENSNIIFENLVNTTVETQPACTEETVEPTIPTFSNTTSTSQINFSNITETERLEDGTRILEFNKRTYTIPYNPIDDTPIITDSGYVEQIPEVPLYLQQDYPKTPYGSHGTVSSHGCGITSCAMVYSYLLDRPIMPDELAKTYGKFNTPVGSDYRLFTQSAEDLGLEALYTYKWEDVEEGLKNGGVVIANVTKETIFTDGGHYIVYYGMTEDGKVLVNDPNIYNYGQWSSKFLKEGFENGFDTKFVKYSFPCWVYSPKNLDTIAAQAEDSIF